MNYYLTVMCPVDYVRGGSQDKLVALQERLATLRSRDPFVTVDDNDEILFSDTPAVHMARFLVIDEMPVQMGNERSGRLAYKYLLFIAELDGDRDSFLDQLFETRETLVKEIWGNCIAFPEDCDKKQFRQFMIRYEIKTTLPFGAYAGTGQPEVTRMLKNRRNLTDFVVDNQAKSPEDLHKAWEDFRENMYDPAGEKLP